jgi:SAM-dependent methyltransferase
MGEPTTSQGSETPFERQTTASSEASGSSAAYKYTWGPLVEVPEMSTYDYALQWVTPGSRVLDIGSGPGFFAAVLCERLGCVVDCVEYNEEAAAKASAVCHRVIRADLQSEGWLQEADSQYDFVLLLDVLEHMSEPLRLAEAARSLLGDTGKLIASVPNVAHGAVRLPLLLGQWDYEPSGILDDSHVKFFVGDSFLDLLGQAGLRAEELQRVYRAVSDEWLDRAADAAGSSRDALQRLLSLTEGQTWQFIALSVPSDTRQQPSVGETSVDRSDDLIEQLRYTQAELAAYERRFGWVRRAWRSLRRE